MSFRKCIMPVNPVQCHLNIELTVPYLKQINIDLIAWRWGEGRGGAQERSGTVPRDKMAFLAVGSRMEGPLDAEHPPVYQGNEVMHLCTEKIIDHLWELGQQPLYCHKGCGGGGHRSQLWPA